MDTEDQPFDYTDTFPWYYIPCLTGSDKVVIYFHGNGEDLGKHHTLTKTPFHRS